MPLGDIAATTVYYLIGGFHPSEKYEFVNWDDDIPNEYGKIKVMFQSPPASYGWSHPPPNH